MRIVCYRRSGMPLTAPQESHLAWGGLGLCRVRLVLDHSHGCMSKSPVPRETSGRRDKSLGDQPAGL